MQRELNKNLYWIYYDQLDRVVAVERIRDDTNKVIAGKKPNGLYSRMLCSDIFHLTDAIDEALLTHQERVNRAKGHRYQRTPELEIEIKLGCSYRAIRAKHGISKATYYRLRNELIQSH